MPDWSGRGRSLRRPGRAGVLLPGDPLPPTRQLQRPPAGAGGHPPQPARRPSARSLTEALRWINAAFVGDPQDVRTWPVLDPLAPHARAVTAHADAAGSPSPPLG